RLETTVSDGSAVQALAWQDGPRTVLWLANLTGAERALTLDGLPAEVGRITTLDLASFAAAASGTDGLTGAATAGPAAPLELGPYALVRLELGG
ncbi:MAG: hypothetical protein ACREH6_13060, partial [Geminicoccaceae bacterium]